MKKIVGRLVTVEQTEVNPTEDSFFKVTHNTNGKEWQSAPSGATNMPSVYWDTLIEDETQQLVKQLHKELSKVAA